MVSFSEKDRQYMEKAILLAKNGMGKVNPNPLVGAVIVKDDRIIGEGWHTAYGHLHAEREAIRSLTESAEGATIYVTLEPCCHYGKQPPCTEALIENKIARVVIGSRDPNPLVAGKGVQILREAGIQVDEDFMREECDALNNIFFHYITTGEPFVAMKAAVTADGKIATRTGASRWVTSEESRYRVQELRNRYAGIMAGIGTVLADDPLLTCRLENGSNPVRIICDSRLRISPESKLCRTAREVPLILACSEKADPERKKILSETGAEILEIPLVRNKVPITEERDRTSGAGEPQEQLDLKVLMKKLGERKIDSILLEGGGNLNFSALSAGIVQRLYLFIAPKIFGGRDAKTSVEGHGAALPSDGFPLILKKTEMSGPDLLLTYDVDRKKEVT